MAPSSGYVALVDTLELPVDDSRRVTWYVAEDARRRRTPRDRPPVVGRVFVGLLGLAAMLVTTALLLSDQAPGVLRALFGERARRLWARIDNADVIGPAAGSDLPASDFLAHVALWAVVTVLVGMAVWTWRGLMIATVMIAASSLVLEAAQGRYATTRTVQATDAVANLIGTTLGAAAAGACFLAWSAGAAAVRRFRPRADRTNLPGGGAGSLR